MDYSVGSLADLITGSNTPNKPKVITKEFKKVSQQIDTLIPLISKEVNERKRKGKNDKSLRNENRNVKKQKLETSENDNTKLLHKKRKIQNSYFSSTENDPTAKKIRLRKNGQNAELRIKNGDQVIKNHLHKKRKVENSYSSSTENEPSSKKIKFGKNEQNAERHIKNADKVDEPSSKKIRFGKNEQNAERRIKNSEKVKNRMDVEELERTVYVGNVPIQTDKKKIKNHFKKYGDIESLRIRGVPVADPKVSKKVAAIKKEFNPNRKNIYFYIRFVKKEDAIKAEAENGVLFEGHHLRVHVCSSEGAPDETKAIFVGNLKFDAIEDDLWQLFETCGPISHVRIIRDGKTGMGKGFGYVNFKDSDAVQLALEMENVKLGDRELRISLSNIKVARKKKSKKNKMISKPGKPKENKSGENKSEKATFSEKQIKKSNVGFQGTKFGDKRKKHKVNKGFLQKKKMVKKLAPKGSKE